MADFSKKADRAQQRIDNIGRLVRAFEKNPDNAELKASTLRGLEDSGVELDTYDLLQLPVGRLKPVVVESAVDFVRRCERIEKSRSRLVTLLGRPGGAARAPTKAVIRDGVVDRSAAEDAGQPVVLAPRLVAHLCGDATNQEAHVLLKLVDGAGRLPSATALANELHARLVGVGK